jgi:hypothetical protein
MHKTLVLTLTSAQLLHLQTVPQTEVWHLRGFENAGQPNHRMDINLIEPAHYREGEDDKSSTDGWHRVMVGEDRRVGIKPISKEII